MQRSGSRTRQVRAALVGCALVAAAVSVASAAGASPRARATSAPACRTAGLVVWLDTQGNGAAGSIYYTLEFTNLSGHSCTLRGYPGVSAVNLAGGQVGVAARRDPAYAPHTVTIAARASATATLRIVEAGNFPPSTCGPVTAAGVRVYPPNQTASRVVPFPFAACSHHADGVLSVRAVR